MKRSNIKYWIALFIVILISAIMSSIAFIHYQDDTIKDLNRIIDGKEKLLRITRFNDSLNAFKTQSYSNVITKYVNDCNFQIDGKTVSTSQLVKLTNNYINENDLLRDSVQFLMALNERYKRNYFTYSDSFQLYSHILRVIKRDYGIEYNIVVDGSSRLIKKENFCSADSGLLLLPHYRNAIKKNNDSTWTITTVKIR